MAAAEPLPLPVDGPDQDTGTVEEADRVSARLDSRLTRALLQGPSLFGVEINDLLLTGLVEGLGRSVGRLRVDLESHGRHDLWDGVDVSRTLGWFTTLFPVDLSLQEASLRTLEEARAAVHAIREQLQAVPSHGLGWGLLRYLTDENAAVRRPERPSPVLFNYLGQLGGGLPSGGWVRVREAPGAVRSPRQRRSHQLEINAAVAGGELTMSWIFNPRVHRRKTVEGWVKGFVEALSLLARHVSEMAIAGKSSASPRVTARSAGSPGAAEAEPPPLRSVPRTEDLPLSFAEQRLWFLDHWDPGKATFNIPVALRLEGRLHVATLEQGLTEVVRRHETLRTTFPTIDGRPLRRIAAPQSVRLQVVDIGDVTEAESLSRRLAGEEAGRPFDLASGPLLRLCLFRLAPDKHVLVSTVHHMISDAWSAGVLVKELASLVASFAEGRPSLLQELAVQYADFAHWQRRWLQGEVLSAQIDYWRSQLADLALFELPTDRPRPEVRSADGQSFTILLPKELGDRIRALSRQHGASLFMTMLAAFKVVLHQRTQRDDVVVGTDVANRNHVETEGLIGFFVNQLTLCTKLSGNPTFVELLERVREVTLDAYANQDLPFEQVVDKLGIERSPSQAPAFQIKFFVTNTPMGDLGSMNVDLSPFEIGLETAQIDLTVAFRESQTGSIGGWINYSTELFDRSTIEELMAVYQDLLAKIVDRPDVRLRELVEFLTKKEALKKMNSLDSRKDRLKKLKSISPKKVSTPPQGEVVKMRLLRPGERLPLMIEPALEEVELSDWSASHRGLVEEKLREHGAVLFRGFGIDSVPRFERFASTLCDELFNENGEHPRESISGNVYTPVTYPKDQKLLMHNENSFNHHWPMKIMFCCLHPAEQGGETPLVDSRKVYERLSPGLVRRFEEAGVMYVRNYEEKGLGLTWQQIFQTDSQDEVEKISRHTRVELEWRENNALRTRAVRPAVVGHPVTGQKVWFNQAQHWHVSCLEPQTRASMESLFDEQSLPRHCYLGDGRSIEDSEMNEILRVYDELEVSFPWQRGDVLVVDNLLTAHGRNPFMGKRKILVALGDMKSFDDVTSGVVEETAR